MRIFEHPNLDHWEGCPICGTKTDKPIVLIGVDGTQDDGIVQAEQFHFDCIELTFVKRSKNGGYKYSYLMQLMEVK